MIQINETYFFFYQSNLIRIKIIQIK